MKGKTKNLMKPNFLVYFTIIITSAVMFAVVYVFFKDVVEANPESFSIGLGTILLIGAYGMLDNIASNTTRSKVEEFE
jgi:hypothetical protein